MSEDAFEVTAGLEARAATVNILDQMEKAAKGRPEHLMILGNSMLAAARLLFARSGIDEKQRADLYAEFWRPLVTEGIDE